MDNLYSWSWREAFWSYWLLFAVLIGITFGSMLMTFSKIFQLCLGEIEAY
jgi:hypothetical protein